MSVVSFALAKAKKLSNQYYYWHYRDWILDEVDNDALRKWSVLRDIRGHRKAEVINFCEATYNEWWNRHCTEHPFGDGSGRLSVTAFIWMKYRDLRDRLGI
jgi:hypothetical protein